MITGDTVTKILYLYTTAGVALSYANKAAFTGAGWALTWYDTAGVALTTQPTYTVTDMGAGRHMIAYTVPTGVWQVLATIPAGKNDPGTWGGEGTTYDEDTLAGIILTSQGVPGVQSAADGTLGDVVDGDAWNSGTLYIPLGKISAFGYGFSDLASGWTFTAGLKSTPSDTRIAATFTAGATIATDGAFSLSWATFPAGLALSLVGADVQSKTWYIDAQLKKTSSGLIVTSNRYALNVVWQRDTTP